MRMILVDHARSKAAGKRGGGLRPVTLKETLSASTERPAGFDPSKSKVIESTLVRDQRLAEAWIQRQMLSLDPNFKS